MRSVSGDGAKWGERIGAEAPKEGGPSHQIEIPSIPRHFLSPKEKGHGSPRVKTKFTLNFVAGEADCVSRGRKRFAAVRGGRSVPFHQRKERRTTNH